MAYRFLLEVPEALADQANAAISSVGDVQVLVVRNSHGLGFDDPYVDFSVAAHSLRVIGALYAWAAELGANRPESRVAVRVVLHHGQRIGLHEIDQDGLVAAIRRDQPWVETSLPKIGEHERYVETPLGGAAGLATAVAPPARIASAAPSTIQVTDIDLVDAEDEITIRGNSWAVIDVLDLAGPERFYHAVLGLELVERIRRESDGQWQTMPDNYDHFEASRSLISADLAFLVNGPLHVALRNVGRAARLDYSQLNNRISIRVDQASGARIKAQCLMRGFSLLGSAGPVFAFRDPFGVAWTVHPTS